MLRAANIICIVLALFVPGAALALTPGEILKDPAQEARARELSRELRCMVCQNQSIDDSDAPLARDLRILVRQRIQAGDTDRQVLDFLVARYGEFVLLRPRFELHTLLLWLLPPLVLLGGTIGLVTMARRRRTLMSEPGNLTPDERMKLSALVEPHFERPQQGTEK